MVQIFYVLVMDITAENKTKTKTWTFCMMFSRCFKRFLWGKQRDIELRPPASVEILRNVNKRHDRLQEVFNQRHKSVSRKFLKRNLKTLCGTFGNGGT